MIGDGQRVAVLMIPQQEFALVICAPELIGVLAEGQLGSLSTTTHPATALHQALTIERPMDGALGGDRDPGKSADEALANFAGTPQVPCSRFTFRM